MCPNSRLAILCSLNGVVNWMGTHTSSTVDGKPFIEGRGTGRFFGGGGSFGQGEAEGFTNCRALEVVGEELLDGGGERGDGLVPVLLAAL